MFFENFGNSITSPAAILAGALAWDIFLGEPPNLIHPVVWMGKSIQYAETLGMKGSPRRQMATGTIVALAIPSAFALVTLCLLHVCKALPWLEFLFSVALLKSTCAVRALGAAATTVRLKLDNLDIPGARAALHSLCSRDPNHLDEPLLIAATVESLAENASDSGVAPLFYFLLWGVPGAVFYRVVNTLDSMIGYHGQYEFFGKASARLDDLLNWIPARLTALLLLCAGLILRKSSLNGWLILRRDARKTESPNAGFPMATMAGLIQVELEKLGHYRLGDQHAPLTPNKIAEAWQLVRVAIALGAMLLFTAFWGLS